jgi:hypothetical protein
MLKGGVFYFENMDVFGIKPMGGEVPARFHLYQNYPNPFNPVTKLKFDILVVETTRRVVSTRIVIYDVLGRQVTTLLSEQLTSGTYEISWDASGYPSGVYFYDLRAGDFVSARRMVLLK